MDESKVKIKATEEIMKDIQNGFPACFGANDPESEICEVCPAEVQCMEKDKEWKHSRDNKLRDSHINTPPTSEIKIKDDLSSVENMSLSITENRERCNLTPFQMMQAALSQNIPMEAIEKMMDLQERHDKNEAKKAYVSAMAKFKTIPIHISKDKYNPKFKSNYSSIGNTVNTVLPEMSKCGLSHKWDIEQNEKMIKVTCIITHAMGHSESVSMSAPPDKEGSKNLIQEIKSTITYLKLCTFESILGLASSDGSVNVDDDGNSSYGSDSGLSTDIYVALSDFKTEAEVRDFYNQNKKDAKDFRAFWSACEYRIKEIEKGK